MQLGQSTNVPSDVFDISGADLGRHLINSSFYSCQRNIYKVQRPKKRETSAKHQCHARQPELTGDIAQSIGLVLQALGCSG